MRLISIIGVLILYLLSNTSLAEGIVAPYDYFVPNRMKLSIRPSFHGKLEYYVSDYSEKVILARVQWERGNGGEYGPSEGEYVSLSHNEFEVLLEKMKLALSFPYGEQAGIEDGETWCLESSMFQPIKVCIKTPALDTKKRGYENLIAYRAYLEGLFK
jgi:hypothetical protein